MLARDDGQGGTRVGVRLNTGEGFWKPVPIPFLGFVQSKIRGWMTLSGGRPSWEGFESWCREHTSVEDVTLEFCSSHVGGFVRAVAPSGAALVLDEG